MKKNRPETSETKKHPREVDSGGEDAMKSYMRDITTVRLKNRTTL